MDARRPPILERVELDIARGDLALARQRLVDRLSSIGYRPDLIAQVARISARMGDPFNAGRFWLLANEQVPEAGPAIAEFVRRAGGTPESVRGALPAFTRRLSLEQYPQTVRNRLTDLGLAEAIARRAQPDTPHELPWRERLVLAAIAVAGVFVLICLVVGTVVGFRTITTWLFG